MKVISFDDIKQLDISPSCCYKWVSDAILHKRESFLPAKIHMPMPDDSFCNIMPSIIRLNPEKYAGCIKFLGVKVVSRYPKREPSLDSKLLLFNADSGEFLTLMDANWITAMRTGAVTAHSVLTLAKKDFSTISIIGLGNTARSFLLVLSSVIPDRQITVKLLKYKNQAELFMNRFSKISNIHFVIVDNMEAAIRNSDVIVSCATYFEDDIAQDEWFDEGVLVVPVHTRGFTNCDLFFDKVFADDKGHVDHFRYFDRFRFFAEMTDVVNGASVGRQNNYERILAYNIGIAIHDIYYAAQIYQMFQVNKPTFDKLIEIDLREPKYKFWI